MKNLSILVVLAMLFVSCTGTQSEQAAKAMLTTQTSIVAVATSADSMCTAGILTQDQCDEIATLYAQAKVSYDLAESTLAIALQTDSDDRWTNYQRFHDSFMILYYDLLVMANEFGILGDGSPLTGGN